MIKIFKNIIKSKTFILWMIVFLGLIYYCYDIIINIKLSSMYSGNNIYHLYNYLFPFAFKNETGVYSVVIGIAYVMIISYVLIQFINYMFIVFPSSILTRVERNKVIKKLVFISIIYSLLILIIYLLFFLIWYFKFDLTINLSINLLITIFIKILLTILLPMIYLLVYINTDSAFLGTGLSTASSVIAELLLFELFDNETIKFNHSILIILLLLIIIIYIYKIIINLFERRDI